MNRWFNVIKTYAEANKQTHQIIPLLDLPHTHELHVKYKVRILWDFPVRFFAVAQTSGNNYFSLAPNPHARQSLIEPLDDRSAAQSELQRLCPRLIFVERFAALLQRSLVVDRHHPPGGSTSARADDKIPDHQALVVQPSRRQRFWHFNQFSLFVRIWFGLVLI